MTVWSFARASKRPQKRERLHVGESRRCASDKTTHALDLPRVEAHERPFLRRTQQEMLSKFEFKNRATKIFDWLKFILYTLRRRAKKSIYFQR